MSERASTRRTALTARTYVRKAVWMLRRDAESENKGVRNCARYDATEFAWMVLGDLEMLVDLVDPSEEVGSPYIEAKRIADRLRARRLSEKLSNVEGRTPEEAALFRARSEKLMAGTS